MPINELMDIPSGQRSQRFFLLRASIPTWIHYLTTIVIVGLATCVLLACQQFVAEYDGLKRGPAFVALFFIAIAICTVIGGFRVGLFSVLLSLFCTAYFLIPPRGLHVLPTMANYFTLGIVVIVGSLVAFGMEAYRNNTRLLVQNLELLAIEQARADQETVLNQIGQAVRTAKSPDQVLLAAVTSVGEILKADRCYLINYYVPGDSASIAHLWLRDGSENTERDFVSSSFGFNLGLLHGYGETVVVPDAKTDDNFKKISSLLDRFGVRSAIVAPLSADAQSELTIIVAMTESARAWTRSEVALVEAVAAQTHAAVDAARNHQKEHNIAIQLQAALQPELSLDIPGLSFSSIYRAALEEANVGGDFYDAVTLPNGNIAFMVGDVSGKGLAAASQVAAIRHMLRSLLHTSLNLVEAVEQLNDVLIEQNLMPAFATLFVAVIDPTNLTLEYISCGHEPGLLYRPGESDEVQLLTATAPVIGVFGFASGDYNDGLFQTSIIQLRPGDSLLLYTDGVCDAGSDVKHLLGVEGVVDILKKFYADPQNQMGSESGDSASDLVRYCFNQTEQFADGIFRDDICLLAVIISPTYDGKFYTSANKLRRNALLPKLARTALVSTNGNGKDIDTENLKKILLADVLRLATREKLRIVTDKRQLPPQLEHKSEPIPLGVGENVRQLRWKVRSVCAEAGLLTEYSDSLEMAAGEAANNSLVHATGGIGLVSWNNNGKVQVKIEDTGTGIPFEDLPRATLERGYTTAGTLGQGFWIILQSVKRCWIATSESGTTVIIEQDNEDPALEDLPVPVLF